MAKNAKQNNRKKRHDTHCGTCGRALPKRAYREVCATCIKATRGAVEPRREGAA